MIKVSSMLFFLIAGALHLVAQDSIVSEMQKNLDNLATVENDRYLKSFARAQQYSKLYNVPLISYDTNGNIIQLVDVDDFGAPVYRSTTNAGAAITTGVQKLRQNGGLGLNLEGSGVTIGIWDGGVVFDHSEFDSRVRFKENSTISDHGTHVAGTMVAAGFNPSARGMASRASIVSYFWDNDISEMAAQARPDQASLLLSNHSYGLVQGWNCATPTTCAWTGTPSISTLEDWRFGFYTSTSRSLDETAFNAPFYSIFWAAGNDRDDGNTSGSGGTNPPDGNGGTGFDSMSQEGCAKNIFTIGAIGKIQDYTGPGSVQMSSFSNWGPTDDGRIKPDLVAAGVSIFSTVSTPSGQSGSRYGTLSGTSMASPNAAGSLALIQELNSQLAGNYLRSSTLKALAIHTAKEAGPGAGPDYMFGWGVLDVEAAAKLLLARDDQNVLVREERLLNGQSFELNINPQAGKKITVTIAWTDPPATPLQPQLDPATSMLVNDLDLRLIDDAGNVQFPWALNPDVGNLSTSQVAFKGDNFRDNVEKIEFDNPEPRPYKVRVGHKRALAGGQQNFSIIVEYKSDNAVGERFFWVGGSGNWNDPTKWSKTSGGPTANAVPTYIDRVVIDENSFSSLNQVINLVSGEACASLTYLAKTNSSLNFNGNTLEISGDLIITNNSLTTSPGVLRFTGAKAQNLVVLSQANLSNLSMIFDTKNSENVSWKISNAGLVNSIDLVKGKLDLSGNSNLKIGSLRSVGTAPRELNLLNCLLEAKEIEWNLEGEALKTNAFTNIEFRDLNSSATIINGIFKGKLKIRDGNLQINGNSSISYLDIQTEVQLSGNNRIDTLILNENSTLRLGASTLQEINKKLVIGSNQAKVTRIMSEGLATIRINGRVKLCFDWLNITNVSMQGAAVVNAGANSVAVNSSNWLLERCEDVLFPDFEFKANCVNGLVEFTDISEGTITNRTWNFGASGFSLFDDNSKKPKVVFTEQGVRLVSLTISNSNSSRTYSKSVLIRPTSINNSPSIIVSGSLLASNTSASAFQWYNGTSAIINAIGRTFPFNGNPGVYYVVLSDGDCNRISSPLVITSASSGKEEFSIYPNPTNGYVTFSVEPDYVEILDVFGVSKMTENRPAGAINVSTIPDGQYVVKIKLSNGEWINRRLIKVSQ